MAQKEKKVCKHHVSTTDLFHGMFLAMLLVAGMSSADGSPITIRATGYVTGSDFGPAADFALGQSIDFTYTYDSEAVDYKPVDPTIGDYRSAISTSALDVGDYHLDAVGGGMLLVDYSSIPAPPASPDRYAAFVAYCRFANYQFCDTVNGPDVAGLFVYEVTLEFTDYLRTSLSSDALLLTAPDVDAFSEKRFSLSFANSMTGDAFFGVKRVYGTISSITTVPVPPALWLFGSALSALAGLRRLRNVAIH